MGKEKGWSLEVIRKKNRSLRYLYFELQGRDIYFDFVVSSIFILIACFVDAKVS